MDTSWLTMLIPTVPAWELLVRGTLTFLGLLFLLRIVGRREAGGLGITDLLVVVLIADAAGAGLRGEAASIGDSALLVGTILFWRIAVDAMSYRWPRLARLVKARPRAIIHDGSLDRRVMRREFMTFDEVMSQLRLHGITELKDVRVAYLEPNGMISVVRDDGAEPEQPVRPEQ
jgi:uncharacterized membrane protein YcaP (DUF421 family)